MSDDTTKNLNAAIARIAALESELRSKPAKESESVFDLVAFRKQLTIDPIGTLRSLQLGTEHIDHVRSVLIADKLGDQAPPQLRVFAAQGAQLVAAHAQAETIAALSRRLDDRDKQEQKATKREAFKSITANKEKYPNLAKAFAADPELVSEMDAHGGTAEEFAASQEAKLQKLVSVFAPSTASVTADNRGQSTQAKPTALAGTLSGDPPPLEKEQSGWTRDQYTKIRDGIVQKYSQKVQ
jgi:hypothetical protein